MKSLEQSDAASFSEFFFIKASLQWTWHQIILELRFPSAPGEMSLSLGSESE